MRIFHEDHYNLYRELLVDSNILRSDEDQSNVDSSHRIHVQLSVSYSQTLDTTYQVTQRLKYFSLTLLQCWLTPTENDHSNIYQVLIENGYFKLR